MAIVLADKLWDEIETLSKTLKLYARQRDWEKLLAIHTQRQRLIVRLFRMNKDQHGLKSRLLILLSEEKDLLSICDDAKNSVSAEILSLRKNRRAALIYSQT